MSLEKPFSSLSVRLQASAIFLSFVGVVFGIKTYLNVKEKFGVEAAAPFYHDLMLQIAVALAVNILVAIVLFQITTRPIKRLSDTMRRITEGDVDGEIPYVTQRTEIGSMARKVEIFRKNAIEKKVLEQHQQDKDKAALAEKRKSMNDLANRFEFQVQVIIEEVMNEVEKVKGIAEQMNGSIHGTTNKTNAAAEAAEQTSQNVGTVASAAEEMSASVREVAGQIQKSEQSVKAAVSANGQANEVSTQLAQAANKIGEIVNLIQSIAGQINLLALNATIESARAGEAGRGFAVVANEVKNLAAQTGKATDEIAGQVENIQNVAKQVMAALGTISSSIMQVDSYSSAIASAIHEQASATDEIAQSIASVAGHTQQISADIMEVNASSSTVSDCAINAMEAVNLLQSNTTRLNEAVEKFLDEVRAA